MPPPERSATSSSGMLVALAAFLAWGLVPLYWRQLSDVSALRIVCHRAIWCSVFLGLIVACAPGLRAQLREALAQRRGVWLSALAGWLIGINWLIFIWAVTHDRVLQSSLGYYLSPLVTVSLGAVVLGEKLPPLRWLAVALAAIGVLSKVIAAGVAPWIALALCSTWGCYALIKRLAGLDTMSGLAIESAALLPPALALLFFSSDSTGPDFFGPQWNISLLLVGGGPVTAIPLLGYAFATRRLTLATLGLMQYITPTITFALGVFLYREHFSGVDFAMFGLIWVALTIYSLAPRLSPTPAEEKCPPVPE